MSEVFDRELKKLERTNSQAAEAMGITDSAFRTRLMRARDLLRKTLGEEADL